MKLEGVSLKKDFMKFIVPSIVAQWVYVLYTMVDGIFVSRGVSEVALAAVNICMPYTMTMFAVSILFAVGTSTVVAISIGEGKKEYANQVFTQNIVLLAIFSVVVAVLAFINIDTLASFLGATPLNREYVVEYLRYLVPFSFSFILSYSFEMLIKTDGYPQKATVIVSTGVVLNIVLDYLLVIRFPFGVAGAAFATGFSNAVVILLYLTHFCGKKGMIKFCKFHLDFSLIVREFKNGLSSGVTEVSTGFVIFLFNQMIIRYLGDDALVSYTIISYINALAVMTMAGIAQGYQPLISYYYGQRRLERCRKLLKYGVIAAAVISIVFTMGCMTATKGIVGLFISTEHQELMNYSVQVFRIFSLSYLVVGYNVVVGGFFIAIEKAVSATVISTLRGIVMISVCVFVLAALFGGNGIWWAPLLSEILTLCITVGLLLVWKKSF